MLPMMGFMQRFLESRDFSRAAGSQRVTRRIGRRSRLADRRDALDEALGRGEESVFVGDYAKRCDGLQQLARTQKEVRVGRLADARVPLGEGLVNQHAAVGD